jgi:hypothetical protein
LFRVDCSRSPASAGGRGSFSNLLQKILKSSLAPGAGVIFIAPFGSTASEKTPLGRGGA